MIDEFDLILLDIIVVLDDVGNNYIDQNNKQVNSDNNREKPNDK